MTATRHTDKTARQGQRAAITTGRSPPIGPTHQHRRCENLIGRRSTTPQCSTSTPAPPRETARSCPQSLRSNASARGLEALRTTKRLAPTSAPPKTCRSTRTAARRFRFASGWNRKVNSDEAVECSAAARDAQRRTASAAVSSAQDPLPESSAHLATKDADREALAAARTNG